MARRFLLRIVALLTAAFSIVTHARAATAEKPNIVLILSDDQAWTDDGFMGHPAIQTPHLDKLAAESLAARKAVFGECFTHNSKNLKNPSASLR